jgi:hypothetical protein
MDTDDVATSRMVLEIALLGAEPMGALRACRSLQTTIAAEVQCRVFDARAQGASWGDVGFALGITKQAAQQRFGD